jgi:hypothetical protein
MKPILLLSVAALLWAGAAQAESAASTSASSAKPAAAAPTVAEVKSPTPQQQKMISCNAEAATRKLAGDARATFMKTCLSAAPAAASTPQERMKDCNARAGEQKLTGDALKSFMAGCLKPD